MKKSVTFSNGNLKMAGNLYLSSGFEENKKYPALVFIHPGGGVKEQTAGLYAERMAGKGFVTLAFDASHQGESEGEPRFLEDPAARVEDARCAVDYLTTLPYVDAERIGMAGICAGGGYAVNAAQTDRRIKAVAGISSVDIGAFFREGFTGTPASEQLKILDIVSRQRTAQANGAGPAYIPYVPESPELFDENTPTLMREGYDYYRTPRGQHPNSQNKMLLTSSDKLMAFTAFAQIPEYLTQPLLMIAGSQADTRHFSERAVALSQDPKELFLVEGATHIALYDIPQYVGQAVGKLTEFFGKNL